MLMNEYFFDKEKYKSMPMSQRMIFDIIAFEANRIFADTVIDVLVKRNPNYMDDPNVKCQIDSFRADWNTAFECRYRFERLYESEYGEIPEAAKESIKKVATEYANIPLVKFGWIKEEKL